MSPEDRSHGLRPVFLSALAHELGEVRHLRDLTGALPAAELETLRGNGFVHYRQALGSTSDLAVASIAKTLAAVPELEVGALVWATNSPSELSTHSQDAWEILRRSSLPFAPPVVVGGNGCGNLAPALRLARDWSRSERPPAVVLVTADRVGRGSRFEPSAEVVLSDGAASCVVGPQPYGAGFRVLGISTAVRAELGSSASFMAGARLIKAGIREALDKLGIGPSEAGSHFRALISGHYSPTTQRLFANLCGFSPDQVHAPLAAELGHCFSSDLLIELGGIGASGALSHGDRLLLLASSPHSWSLMAVEYADDRPLTDHC